MGFKDFVNKMAEKQAESNAKIKSRTEKFKEDQAKIRASRDEMLDALHPFGESKKTKEKEYQKERLQQLKRDHVPFCPKCKSINLTFVNQKLSLGRTVVGAVVGSVVTLGIGTAVGATMGGLSSKKGKVKCLNCGHTWKL